MTVVNHNKLFDRRDNTFLLSNRKIADKLKVSSSTIDRLFRTLKKHNLVKKVINGSYNIDGSSNSKPAVMLSPRFLFISYTNSDRWFIGALWTLEHIKKVYDWSKLCRELNCFICPDTGEIKPFNWYEIDNKANYYTSFDRCYRKKSKCVYSTNEDENNSLYYRLDELNSSLLHEYDYEWFDTVNSVSSWNYKPTNKDTFKPKTSLNICTVKLEYDPRITECIQEMIKSGLITARR